MGRCQSTPGLVESRGRITLEEMWVAPPHPPGTTPYSTHSLFTPGPASPTSRSLPSHVRGLGSPMSATSSGLSSEDDRRGGAHTAATAKRTGAPARGYGACGMRYATPAGTAQLLETTPLVTACASEHSSASPTSGDLPAARGATSTAAAGAAPTGKTGVHETLVAEIKWLRQRLATVETENAAMSVKLSRQQWDVEHRLAEIEMQICGASSGGSSTEDCERNRESII